MKYSTEFRGPRNGLYELLQRRARTATSLVTKKVALHSHVQLHRVPVASSAWGNSMYRHWDGQRGANWAKNRDIPVSSYRRGGSTLNSICGAHSHALHKLSTPPCSATNLVSLAATPARIFAVPPDATMIAAPTWAVHCHFGPSTTTAPHKPPDPHPQKGHRRYPCIPQPQQQPPSPSHPTKTELRGAGSWCWCGDGVRGRGRGRARARNIACGSPRTRTHADLVQNHPVATLTKRAADDAPEG